jgi:cysteine desulfurase
MPVYLDHAATSPIRPSVLAHYSKALEQAGNPASVHSFGQSSRQMLEEARESLAAAIGCDRNEVIFTSGGTESDNLAVKGLYWRRHSADSNRRLIITSAAEHAAVLDAVNWLVAEQGAKTHFVSLDSDGVLNLQELAQVLSERSDEVALISLMWANNEIGVVHPIAQIVELARRYSIPVHSDAIAALGHIPVNFSQSGLTALTITGHKIGSPVGVGALIVSRGTKLTPVVHGGGQEAGLRSGTPDAAAASAMAEATRASANRTRHMCREREVSATSTGSFRFFFGDVAWSASSSCILLPVAATEAEAAASFRFVCSSALRHHSSTA